MNWGIYHSVKRQLNKFGNIENLKEINQYINMIPGVVDNGLFIKLANKIIVGYKNGDIDTIKRFDG